MNTPAQLRLAADILETGHPWETSHNGEKWWTATTSDSPAVHVLNNQQIRPILATPPYPATLHNPDNLTAEQVGVGYRLIATDERSTKQNPAVEYWDIGRWHQVSVLTEQHCGVNTYRLPLSVPWPEQPKPFTLPTPPPGMRWHTARGWKEGDLPTGWRPLCFGEKIKKGDQGRAVSGGWADFTTIFGEVPQSEARTTRPLLFMHSGHEWTWHRAGDPCPCGGEKMVVCMTLIAGAQKFPTAAKNYLWESDDANHIIGWRYADAEKPDPYAELKKAHAEGKKIEFFDGCEWNDAGSPSWICTPENYRIKPDEIPWTEWHGGECPLRDDEVEEWEYKMRCGTLVPSHQTSHPTGCTWRHDEDGCDITAYRVLKTRDPKPKVPLSKDDVPPNSVFRANATKVDGDVQWWSVKRVEERGVVFNEDLWTWEELASSSYGWQINRPRHRDSDGNPTKWEACEK